MNARIDPRCLRVVRLLGCTLVASTLFALLFDGLHAGASADRIRPLHAVHAANDVGCETCHAGVLASKMGTDDLLPRKEACTPCHDVEDVAACETCHEDAAAPLPIARLGRPAERFNHEAHHGRDIECATCHPSDGAGEPTAAAKATCRGCHATTSGLTDCETCHGDLEPRRPVSHTSIWGGTHAIEARVGAADCANCHTQTDCEDCHSGENVNPRVHPLDFEFGHARVARNAETDCASCHEEREFCGACHLAERVLPQSHSRSDWLISTSGGRHAEEARFDLESCAACHEADNAAPTCAPCHGR